MIPSNYSDNYSPTFSFINQRQTPTASETLGTLPGNKNLKQIDFALSGIGVDILIVVIMGTMMIYLQVYSRDPEEDFK